MALYNGSYIMLKFSTQVIQFEYVSGGHLQGSLTINNETSFPANFKCKITRPKMYMIKPDRGSIAPYSSIKLQIALHKDGIEAAHEDKVKVFYAFHQEPERVFQRGFENDPSVQNKRITVEINNLPEHMRKIKPQRHSASRASTYSSAYREHINNDEEFSSTPFQKVDQIKMQETKWNHKMKLGSQKGPGKLAYATVAVLGLLVGVLTTRWF